MVMLMLVGAIAMSLALGVLAAYSVCLSLFRVFRWHSISAARERIAAAGARVAVDG